MSEILIGRHRIGTGHPAYIVAEMSANHNGSYASALAIVHAARDAGADAIKLQTYTPDTITMRSDEAGFQVRGGSLWDGRTLYDLYAEASTPWEWHAPLKQVADSIGIDFFSSPFDLTAIELLEQIGVAAYKIASFELVDHALIEAAARTGKPLIISTGMATLDEITEAVKSARGAGAQEIALLKCTSAYPAPAGAANLRTMVDLESRFGVPAGLSDHTLGIAVPVAAAALGAKVIEKHLTLSRETPGPDSAFSLEPAEFAAMVRAVREAEAALGAVRYTPTDSESAMRPYRRSLFAVRDIAAGELLTSANVRSIRPGSGLPPKHLNTVLGRSAAVPISAGTPLQWELIDGQAPPQEGK